MEPGKETFVLLKKKNGKHSKSCIVVWKSVVGEADICGTVGRIVEDCVRIP